MGFKKQMDVIKESRRRILNESGERGNSKGGKVKLLVDIYDFNNSKVEAGIFVDDGFADDEDRILKDVKRIIGMVRDHWNPKIVEVPDSTRKMVSIENLKTVSTPEAAFTDLEDVLKEYEVSLIDWKEDTIKESRRSDLKESTEWASMKDADEALATLLWTETDDSDEPLDRNFGVYDFSEEDREKMRQLLDRFYEKAHELFTEEDTCDNWTHDFILTVNGHGAGFWDGDYVNGDELTKLTHEVAGRETVHAYADEDEDGDPIVVLMVE